MKKIKVILILIFEENIPEKAKRNRVIPQELSESIQMFNIDSDGKNNFNKI